MELTSRLARPFKNRYHKYAGKVSGFVDPIKGATLNLLGKLPKPKVASGSDEEIEGQAAPAGKLGLMARLKSFKRSLKEMSDFQKLILLTIAVCLPAGILISTILVGVIKKHNKK